MKNMMMNRQINFVIQLLPYKQWRAMLAGMLLVLAGAVHATPVVVKGVVPDAETKQRIVQQLQSIYGNLRVVDEIEVNPNVRMPPGWRDIVDNAIQPELKKISQGRLEIHGPLVGLYGKIKSSEDSGDIANRLFSSLTDVYQLNNQLEVQAEQQQVIDDTLANRIIEFAPASAELTPLSLGILDEMASALQRVGTDRVEIIGHTDSVGDPTENQTLSQKRADAVKQYLIGRNISENRMTTRGEGADSPVASNSTEEGRKRNRRIEFKLIQ